MGTSFYGFNDNDMVETAGHVHAAIVHLHDDPDADFDDPRQLEVASGNFPALSSLLGLVSDDGDCMGSMSIPEARRVAMRARATFDRKAPELVREAVTEYGAPRAREDGSIELRPVRLYGGGLSRDQLERYVSTFGELVEALAARGATRIAWA